MTKDAQIEQGRHILKMLEGLARYSEEEILRDHVGTLNEIDARFWCFSNAITFLKPKLGRDIKGGLRVIGYRTKEIGDISTWMCPNHPDGKKRWKCYRSKFTRCRTALKSARPDGWYFYMSYNDGIYTFVYHKGNHNLPEVHGDDFTTEELAELHAITQARIWELENGGNNA